MKIKKERRVERLLIFTIPCLMLVLALTFLPTANAEPLGTYDFGDITLSGGFQAGYFCEMFDLTQSDMFINFTYDGNGLIDDFGGNTAHAWAELGVRTFNIYSNFNPPAGSGIWLATDYEWSANTFDPDVTPNLDLDDKLILQKVGGQGEGAYNLPSPPPAPGNNHRFWWDRDGVDPYQNPATANTGGIYQISIKLHATSNTAGTAYMKIRGLDQGFEVDGNWNTIELTPAGMTFNADMTKLRIFYGIYGYGATHSVTFNDITVTGTYIGCDDFVCRNTNDNIEYCTIQEAIDASATTNGETIEIYAGTHIEKLTVSKSLTLYGQGIGSTILTSNTFPVITVSANDVTIRDLTITHSVQLTEGIRVVSPATTGLSVERVAFTNIQNAATNAYGISIQTTFNDLSVVDCDFIAKVHTTLTRGMGIFSGKNFDLTNFEVRDSTFQNLYVGIYLGSAINGLDVFGNTFGPQQSVDCAAAVAGIYIGDGVAPHFDIDNVEIADNTFTQYGRGVYIWNYGTNEIIGNFAIHDNTFTNSIWSSAIRFIAGLNGGENVAYTGPIAIYENTFTQTAELTPGAAVALIDFRSYCEIPFCDISIIENSITFSGSYTHAKYAIKFDAFNDAFMNVLIENNIISGGNVLDGKTGTIPASGIVIDHYSSTQWPSDSFTMDILYNEITGFDHGISIYDYDHTNYGGLSLGSDVNIHCNEIYDNALYGVRNDNVEIVDATCNWWGDVSGPSGAALGTGDRISANVDYTPWVGYLEADANGPYTSSTGLVTFDASGTLLSGCCDETVISYSWNFGDGNSGTGINPTHQYTSYGTFSVTLTVTVTTLGHTYQDTDTTIVTISGNIIVDKTVYDGTAWVNNIRVINGTNLNFKITITNNGGLTFTGATITDYLSLPQLKYLYNAVPTPTSASDNQVLWTINIPAGQTITITYSAATIHVCYGWNSVYLKNDEGVIMGYDLAKIKVVDDPALPALAITSLVWDEDENEWTDYIDLTLNKNIQFKLIISSTALSTAHNVVITDILPALISFNNDATLTPTSASPNEIVWAIGDVSPGDEIEIIFTASTLSMGSDYATARLTSTEGYADEDYVLLETDLPPTITLLYPIEGETIKDSITIHWYAHDLKDEYNLPIFFYLKKADGVLVEFPENPYANNGGLIWDTTIIPDGNYQLQIATQDSNNNVVNVLSSQFQIKNTQTPTENLAPVTPGRPSGSSEGKPGLEYTYSASTVDPEGDQVYYLWDWGDGTNSGWLGPYTSGDVIETPHTWAAKGSYSIKVMAKDSFGLESDWSESLPITMPYTYKPLQQFLENLFEQFPNMFPILRQLFGY